MEDINAISVLCWVFMYALIAQCFFSAGKDRAFNPRKVLIVSIFWPLTTLLVVSHHFLTFCLTRLRQYLKNDWGT